MIPYRSSGAPALQAGAQRPSSCKDFALIASFRSAASTPSRASWSSRTTCSPPRGRTWPSSTRTGELWLDHEQLAWVDPFREEVWAYDLRSRRSRAEGVRRDPVRLRALPRPTGSSRRLVLAAQHVDHAPAHDRRVPGQGAARARARPASSWRPISSATRPSTRTTPTSASASKSWRPSRLHLPDGVPVGLSPRHSGLPQPREHPYEVVRESVRLIRQRSQHTRQVRPWLEDFKDYAFDKRICSGSGRSGSDPRRDEGGAVGWMLLEPEERLHGRRASPKAMRREEASE